jgi:two-component system nitrate/nitrite response regulator NarL
VTRVAIVAATAAVRTGLAALIGRSEPLVITVVGASIEAIAEDSRLASTEVILLHLSTPNLTVRDLDALPPIPVVVLLRGPPAGDAIPTLLAAGARGVLSDDATTEEITAAAEAAAAGLVVLPSEQIGDLVESRPAVSTARDFFGLRNGSSPVGPPLTPREREILAMLAEGLPNKIIASRLGISDHTVKTHLEAIFDKLGASNRADAVARAVRTGLLLL